MFMDKAGWHISKKLKLPDNLTVKFFPPYIPELNPQENIWKYLRTNHFANVYTKSLEDVEKILLDAVPKLTENKDLIRSIAGYSWIISAV